MSDDEEIVYKKPQKTIHYGTLDNSDWIKQNALEDIQSDEDEYEPDKKKAAIGATPQTVSLPAVGNIHLSNEYFDLEQEMCVTIVRLTRIATLNKYHFHLTGRRIRRLCWKNSSVAERPGKSM